MKTSAGKLFNLFFILALTQSSFAQQQNFEGAWQGVLHTGVDLRLVFHLNADAQGHWKATLDSPDQSSFGIPTDSVSVSGSNVFIKENKLKISYEGGLTNDSTITGTFHQGEFRQQLVLHKTIKKLEAPKRPQTPKPPYPYLSLDVLFTNAKTGITYGATYTRPAYDEKVIYKKLPLFPAIVFITGSGAQDRDETIFNHKPFAVIADYLTRRGFACLRIDDRGVGKTTGVFDTSTSLDFSNDVEAALNYLKSRPDIDKNKMGLLGHSEGGMIAPMVAARRKDVKFLVLLAGPGTMGADLLAEQNAAIFKSQGVSDSTAAAFQVLFRNLLTEVINTSDSVVLVEKMDALVNNWSANDQMKKELNLYTPEEKTRYRKTILPSLENKWMRYFLAYDPTVDLKNLRIPVLAINGERDIQVLPASNIAGIKNAFSKNPKYLETKIFPGANHLFQLCKTCTVMEYASLEQTVDPQILVYITNWLKKVTK
ncbi:MAG: alpha/beta hydrolase [Ferruginibacter sp.]